MWLWSGKSQIKALSLVWGFPFLSHSCSGLENAGGNMICIFLGFNFLLKYNFRKMSKSKWLCRTTLSEFCFQMLRKESLDISSVQFSCSVVSDSLQPHESQHARPPCPSPTSWVHPNPCPSSQWCHPTISSFVVPFSPCPQSFPASGFFQTSQLFTSGGQSIGVSASISVLPMNTQDWSPLGWTGWISLQSKGL